MQRSESITKIAAALVKAQLEMGNAVKDAVNPFFKKNYADINAVREAVLPSLNKHGVSAIQPTCVVDGKNYVETVLLHESGEYISSLTEIIVDKVGDAQRHGSGLSYARRYALQSIANIGTEDDDANGATGKAAPATQQQPAPVATVQLTADQLKAQRDLAEKKLNGSKSLDELKKNYSGLSKDLQTSTAALKDALKLKLTPTTA